MLKLVTTCAVALIAFTGCTLNFNVPETKQADSMPTHAERQSVSPEPAPIDEMKGHICAGILDQFDRISASNFTSEAMAAAYREMARLVSTDPRIAEYSAQIDQYAAAIEQGNYDANADDAFTKLEIYCADAP